MADGICDCWICRIRDDKVTALEARIDKLEGVIRDLRAMDVITTDPNERERCCGLLRSVTGLCAHRDGHPIFVDVGE